MIYRDEVTAIIGAPAGLVVETRRFAGGSRKAMTEKKKLSRKERSEQIRIEAENSPIVRQLRELYARGMAELAERRKLDPNAR